MLQSLEKQTGQKKLHILAVFLVGVVLTLLLFGPGLFWCVAPPKQRLSQVLRLAGMRASRHTGARGYAGGVAGPY